MVSYKVVMNLLHAFRQLIAGSISLCWNYYPTTVERTPVDNERCIQVYSSSNILALDCFSLFDLITLHCKFHQSFRTPNCLWQITRDYYCLTLILAAISVLRPNVFRFIERKTSILRTYFLYTYICNVIDKEDLLLLLKAYYALF